MDKKLCQVSVEIRKTLPCFALYIIYYCIKGLHYEVSTVVQGGFLKILKVDPTHDNGLHTCIVRSRSGEEARRDLQIIVNSPPVIEEFSFPKNLQEGGRAQVSCSVSSGDMPMHFSWFKDCLLYTSPSPRDRG